jgi:hypothetical protein
MLGASLPPHSTIRVTIKLDTGIDGIQDDADGENSQHSALLTNEFLTAQPWLAP